MKLLLLAAVTAALPAPGAPPRTATPAPAPATAQAPAPAKPGAAPVKPAAPAKGPTPVADRVVRFAALNKRTGVTQQFEGKPGMVATFGGLTIRVRTCETTPEWEQKQTAAFLQIDEALRGAPPRRIFSGWMFAESPSLNPLESPRYDVWVNSCAMTFPETGPDTIVAGRGEAKGAAKDSSAKKSPSPASADSN